MPLSKQKVQAFLPFLLEVYVHSNAVTLKEKWCNFDNVAEKAKGMTDCKSQKKSHAPEEWKIDSTKKERAAF